jgi:two-component system sensor kinase FixL
VVHARAIQSYPEQDPPTAAPMSFSILNRSRIANLSRVFLLIFIIAIGDWRVNANVPLGLLYLLPMALAGASLTRFQISMLAAICTALAEEFDGFAWTTPTAIPRDILYFSAFCGIGLFVHEARASRLKSVLHLSQLEKEVEARREAEEQLKVLVESSPVAIFTADANGCVLIANNAANRLLLVEPGQLQGQKIDSYFPSLMKIPALQGGQLSFRTVMQCRGQRRDGEAFIAEVWFSTYLTSVGPRLAAMVVDTSQDLRDREEENLHHLLAGSRILVGAVSHEVRNVCGAIAVVHENLARSGVLESSKDFEALGTLVLALERIASLDLRQAAEEPIRVDLNSFFEELRIVVSPGLREESIEDSWEPQASLPLVWADRQSLMQVFLNLIRNSEAAMATQSTRRLRIVTCVELSHVFVSVIDNGPGVDHPELLFRPFQQKSQRVGLGLYLSRALMRSFQGDLRYQPSREGAVFIVELARAMEVPRDAD